MSLDKKQKKKLNLPQPCQCGNPIWGQKVDKLRYEINVIWKQYSGFNTIQGSNFFLSMINLFFFLSKTVRLFASFDAISENSEENL